MINLTPLTTPHQRFPGGCTWALTPRGISIDGAEPVGTRGEPATVRRIWREFRVWIEREAHEQRVPAELIIATIATESGGNHLAERHEPYFVSYEKTPHRVSIGVMQTLISTARWVLPIGNIGPNELCEPSISIWAGTRYIARQSRHTLFDPPVVACAYNAGGVYLNDGAENRWRMRMYPIGRSDHADRFVAWTNDCFRMYEADGGAPEMSFWRMIREQRSAA